MEQEKVALLSKVTLLQAKLNIAAKADVGVAETGGRAAAVEISAAPLQMVQSMNVCFLSSGDLMIDFVTLRRRWLYQSPLAYI